MNTMVYSTDPTPPEWLANTQVICDRKWIAGRGDLPCHIMFIGEFPGKYEMNTNKVFTGPAGDKVKNKISEFGVDVSRAYYTNLVKFRPKGKKPNTEELKVGRPLLEEEIKRANPKIIVTMGALALAAVMGKGYKLTSFHGTAIPHPDRPDTVVVPMYSPAYVLHKPDAEPEYDADWRALAQISLGQSPATDDTEYTIYHTAEEVRKFREWLLGPGTQALLVIDAEWHGKNWQDPTGYLRTLQIGYDIGHAIIIEFFDEKAQPMIEHPDQVWAEINQLLTHPQVGLVGHAVRADGEWLATYGVDIRNNVVYDTMVAEHLLNGAGQFGLESLTTRYTNLGRYDLELMTWKNDHKAECRDGFGPIPSEILMPYGAKDVDAPRRIMEKQVPRLQKYMEPRGQYPSLWDVDMHAQDILYELEQTGLLVDQVQLHKLIGMYQEARSELEGKILTMAGTLGVPDFNPNSHLQVRKMLFDTLKMTPVSTTGGKNWSTIAVLPAAAQAEINPSTDKETLAILADVEGAHPLVGLLRDYRKVSYVCNQWLCDVVTVEEAGDDPEEAGGLLGKLWPDGRIHARFSQLKETARFGSAKPNVQNWMKKAEGELRRIICDDLKLLEKHFGEGAKFPKLRSVVVPTPGYVFMEADWKQAEMFALAGLSGDARMWDALTTPGKDLHDTTALEAFGIKMYGPDGMEVPEEYMLKLAENDPNWDSPTSEFSKLQKQLIYVDQRGRRLSRKQFKDGIRVSAKNLNFGIPYGRGAQDIAIQVKAETGSTDTIQSLKEDIDVMMEVWKTQTYPDAWNYMLECAETVVDPGVLVNPWGRERIFPPTHDREQIAKMGREAQNFPIQSTVADTCLITLKLMVEYRKAHNLHFRIVNQIHDAILLEVPTDEIEQTRTMFKETMGNIQIPMPGREPLCLGLDIDVMPNRWAE